MNTHLRKKIWLLAMLLPLAASPAAWGVEAELEALKKDVEKLEEEQEKYKIIGLLQTIYAGTDGDAGTPVASGSDTSDNSFFMKRARLGVKGKVVKNVSFKFLAEFDNGVDTRDDREPRVLDALISYKLGAVKLKVGQQKYPWDIEGYSSAEDLPFVERNIGVATFVHPDRKFCRYRDVGLVATAGGKKQKWQVSGSLINGSGISRRDTNDDKDIVLNGRVWPAKGLLVNAGVYEGTSDPNATTGANDISKWTAGFQYDLEQAVGGGEYYSADFDKVKQEWRSFYLYALWRITPKWDIGIRYGELKDDKVGNSTLHQTDVVLTYYINKKKKGLFRGQKISLRYVSRNAGGGLAGSDYKNVANSLGLRGGQLGVGEEIGDVYMVQFQLEY